VRYDVRFHSDAFLYMRYDTILVYVFATESAVITHSFSLRFRRQLPPLCRVHHFALHWKISARAFESLFPVGFAVGKSPLRAPGKVLGSTRL
jgi:hypothetical protein